MDDLIKALQIMRKYCENEYSPCSCEHDILYVNCVDPEKVSEEDIKELEGLGFHPNSSWPGFYSFRFGSC